MDDKISITGENADLVELPSGADRGPQTCESGTEYEDARHLFTLPGLLGELLSCHNHDGRNQMAEPAPTR